MKILRPEVEQQIRSSGGMMELVDNLFITALNVTTQELDFISGESTDEEQQMISYIMESNLTFSQKRQILVIRNKYLKLYVESEHFHKP